MFSGVGRRPKPIYCRISSVHVLYANWPLYNPVWATATLTLLRFAGCPSSGAVKGTLWRTLENATWVWRGGTEKERLGYSSSSPQLISKPNSLQEYRSKAQEGKQRDRTTSLPACSYLCTGSGGWGLWAAACPPWRQARCSGRSRALCTLPSPTPTASGGCSRSATGWYREP